MNGAYLFNDSTDQEVATFAAEIASNPTQLRNSDIDFWEKKIIVTSLGDYTGVSVKALTTSPTLNQLIEKKVDALMNSYKDVFKDVTIQKLNTVNSQEVGGSETTVSNFNVKQLVLRMVVVFVFAGFMVIFINFAWYLFNPTMNRAGDFKKYDIHQVFEIENAEVLRQLIRYKKETHGNFAVVTSSKTIAKQWENKIQDVTIEYVEASNFERICQFDAYLFVEEFGKTRYVDFEKKLQELHNFDKKIINQNQEEYMKVLVLNCGSSSIKFQLIDMTDETVLMKGIYERVLTKDSVLKIKCGRRKICYRKSGI